MRRSPGLGPAARRSVAALGLALALVGPGALAAAQDEDAIADDVADDAPSSADDVSDTELVRWASRELARAARRAVGDWPPVPPDAYLGAGTSRDLRLAGEDSEIGLRLVAELGGGALGLLVGGGAGALFIWAVAEGNAGMEWLSIAVGTAVALGGVGLSAGVTLAGELTGGRGNFGFAFLGQVVGALLALPLVALGQAQDALALTLVAAGVLPLGGAILGYELAHADRPGGGGPIAMVVPTRDGALATVAAPLP
ncbi:MAG: hypothetical protein KF729_26995 [Sandaracinaceae bacterium]|nr:hypothetical protein [Sandaracinaceae bacterium]